MYLEMATEEDKKMIEGWKADADGILIFTGLFSAAVASLISVSIQDIRPNPQDTSNFFLANIYQTLADPNRSDIAGFLPASPPPFSPPNHAVWVNTLLFLSLVISISCALLATLLQQWARRYLKVTQPRYSLHRRARIRAFFFEGVEKFLVPWAVEALPTLLHVSLFLFFAGISVFLWNVNLTIFKLVVSWVGVCTALYGCITFVPIFRHDSPYHTPLSLPASHIVAGILVATFWVLRWLIIFTAFCYPCLCFGPLSLDRFAEKAYDCFKSLEESCREFLLRGPQRTVEQTALNSPSEIDTRAFLWTFDSLDEDHELERFFSGLPGFRSSKVVNDPLPGLTREQKWKLSTALMGLLDVTFSSDLLPEPVKDRRAIICAKASDPAHIPKVSGIFDKILSRYQYNGPMSAEIVQVMSGWRNNWDDDTNLVATVCTTVARVQRHDDSWFVLASNVLGVQEPVLREYATHGDSLSLAILIHITRQHFSHFWDRRWPDGKFSKILETASKFNVEDTLPELQHEFCALWNQVRSNDKRRMAGYILRPIWNVYIALHRDTDSAPIGADLWDPSSYPACNIPGHSPNSTPHIHDDSSSTIFARTDNSTLVPASLAGPDVLSSSVPAPFLIDEDLTNIPPLDTYTTCQTITESSRTLFILSDTATAGTARDIVTPGTTMPHSAPESSIPAPSLSSASPPVVLSLQYNEDPLAPSDGPSLPSVVASNLILDNILPTVTTARASSGLTSAPDLGATAEGDGNPKPTSRKGKDAPETPSENMSIYTNTMPTLDLLPQLPSLPYPSHGQYDIV
ncbi:hypothetical protein EDB87DRAFT_1126221 [Lactarius vividus]|nr:hypothetical protein EDB87DRAFT_1126221 [Lactarius vividus]